MNRFGNRAIYILNTFCLFTTICSHATTFETIVTEYQKKQLFRGIVLIADDTHMIYEKVVGYSNDKLKKLNTIASQFLIGSITKQFTAAAILKLIELGKIKSLSDTLDIYLPKQSNWWTQTMPDWFSKVTIHQLLSHSGCLPEYVLFSDFSIFYQNIHSTKELLNYLTTKPLLCQPGSKYEYSGTGYNLLGILIEAASGQSYQHFMQEHILQPAIMNNSYVPHEQMLFSVKKIVPHLSDGYILDKKKKNEIMQASNINLSTAFAEASLICSAQDLLNWNNALYSGKIIDINYLALMTKPHFITNELLKVGSGYGLFIDESGSQPVYFHGGKIDGYSSALLYDTSTKLSVVILSNIYDVDTIDFAFELLEIYKKNKHQSSFMQRINNYLVSMYHFFADFFGAE